MTVSRGTTYRSRRLHLLAYTRLIRIGNLLILAFAVGLGGVLSAGPQALTGEEFPLLLLVAVSAVAIAAAGNAINDIYDQHIDLVNRPDRPLPSGAITRGKATLVWAGGTGLGILLGLSVSFSHSLVAMGCAGLLYTYSARLKAMPFVGNLAVAVLAGMAVVYGALRGGLAPPVWAGAGFAFSATLAREIVKDVQDMEGDASSGLRTLPISWGDKKATLAASMILLLTVLASPLPFLVMGYGGIYLIAVLVTDAVLLRAVWILLERGEAFALRASRLTKWGMVLGIVALALYWVG